MLYRATDTVALTNAITAWLVEIGIASSKERAEIAVDLADIIAAVSQVEADVKRLLQQTPFTPVKADVALLLATNIEVQLFTELSSHIENLRRVWPSLLERLDARAGTS